MLYISCSIILVSFPNCNKCKLDYLNIYKLSKFCHFLLCKINALPTNVQKFNFSNFENSF